MERIFSDARSFRPIVPRTMYEADFEGRIRRHRDLFFPGWWLVEFNESIHAPSTSYGGKRPDFALIHKEFRDWWIVEVELSHHSLESHVEPQVAVFAEGQYGTSHADSILRHTDEINPPRLHQLVTSVQPGVLVIVNDEVVGWDRALSHTGCEIWTVKCFQDDRGNTSYLMSGKPLRDWDTLLTNCRTVDSMPRSLVLENPASVSLQAGEIVCIECADGESRWKFAPLASNVFLFACDGWPFPREQEQFQLHQDRRGVLRIEHAPSRRRRRV